MELCSHYSLCKIQSTLDKGWIQSSSLTTSAHTENCRTRLPGLALLPGHRLCTTARMSVSWLWQRQYKLEMVETQYRTSWIYTESYHIAIYGTGCSEIVNIQGVPKKSCFFNPEAYDPCLEAGVVYTTRLCLAISNNFWLFLAIYGYLWLFMAIYGYLCLFLSISVYFWLFLAISGYLWLFLAISNYVWLYLAISG